MLGVVNELAVNKNCTFVNEECAGDIILSFCLINHDHAVVVGVLLNEVVEYIPCPHMREERRLELN